MIAIEFAPATPPDEGALALLCIEGAAPAGLGRRPTRPAAAPSRGPPPPPSSPARRARPAPCWRPAPGCSAWCWSASASPRTTRSRGMEEAGGARRRRAGARRAGGRLAVDGMPASHAAHAALGARLRSYRFDRYRTKEAEDAKPRLGTLTVLTDDPDAARPPGPRSTAIARGTRLARDLISEPPNVLNPAEMAERCRALAELGVEVDVLGPAELEQHGFGALLAIVAGQRQRAAPRRHALEGRRRRRRRRSASSARASPSTPAASASSPAPAWAT